MERSGIPNATEQDFSTALKGLSYPVSKDEALRHARDQGGVDHEVADIMQRIPERAYDSESELLAALRTVYLLEGVPPDASPI